LRRALAAGAPGIREIYIMLNFYAPSRAYATYTKNPKKVYAIYQLRLAR
jgi:hypothetical protein